MSTAAQSPKAIRIIAIVVIVAGAIFIVAGIGAWAAVRSQLAAENIVVADDAGRFAGQPVEGPFTAYEQANVINKHALAATDGKTYAELAQDDPARATAMTASFLRSSLFTSVLAFGVAAMAAGMGVVFILIGFVLLQLDKRPASPAQSES